MTAGNWAALAAIGRTPLDDLGDAEASVWLSKALMLWLCQGDLTVKPSLNEQQAVELRQALAVLSEGSEAFHREPAFDLYLQTLGHGFDAALQGFLRLARACSETPRLDWTYRLRTYAVQLADPYDYFGDLTAQQHEQLHALPQTDVVLADAYAAAQKVDGLTEEDRLMLQVVGAELGMKMVEPWDYERAALAMRQLAELSAEELALLHRGDEERLLTPLG